MAESINNNLTETNFFEDEFSDSEHKSYKLYNFRRPDKFSKDNQGFKRYTSRVF